MGALSIVTAMCLLPLFPFSWVFNRFVGLLPAGAAQGLAVVALPQLGLQLLRFAPPARALSWLGPHEGMAWAVVSALLYGFRTLSVRELGIWTRLLASSGLALVWVGWWRGLPVPLLALTALSWTVPAAVLFFLVGALSRRLGGAYLGLRGGLVAAMPRMAASITLTVLALTATPLFATFFATLGDLRLLPLSWLPGALPLLFLWGWVAGRLFQDVLFGNYRGEAVTDLGRGAAALTGLALLATVALGFYGSGVGL